METLVGGHPAVQLGRRRHRLRTAGSAPADDPGPARPDGQQRPSRPQDLEKVGAPLADLPGIKCFAAKVRQAVRRNAQRAAAGPGGTLFRGAGPPVPPNCFEGRGNVPRMVGPASDQEQREWQALQSGLQNGFGELPRLVPAGSPPGRVFFQSRLGWFLEGPQGFGVAGRSALKKMSRLAASGGRCSPRWPQPPRIRRPAGPGPANQDFP